LSRALKTNEELMQELYDLQQEHESLKNKYKKDISFGEQTRKVLEKRIFTLTHPSENKMDIALEDLFNIKDLQKLQDEISDATGVASIITRPDGVPLTAPSNFTYLCSEIIRKTEKGCENCHKSDSIIGQLSPLGPTVQECKSGGLWDAGAGISVGDKHIANWLIGQVRDESQTDEKMAAYAKEIGADEEKFLTAFRQIRSMSKTQFEKIAKVLYTLTTLLSKSAYDNLQQSRFINERLQAEQALQESEEKLATLFAAMTEMVVIHDLLFDENNNPINYRITDSNNAFTKITGITREIAVGKLANELYGTDEPPYLDEYSQVCLSGKPYSYETYFAPMEKHFSISVVSTGENKFATITKDITELKQIQQVIKTKNKELEQIVYVASHDLRSPLINVDGFGRELEYSLKAINSLMKANDTESDIKKLLKAELPEMNQALGHIRNSTLQMDVLLNGLLKLSRSGRVALQILTIDMNELLQKATESLEFKAKKSGNEIELSELPSCKGDSVQLTQVFTNLIDNSIKYSNPNLSGKIKVSGRIEHSYSVYCVEDNGIGIAENHLSNIFELFHRLDKNTTEGEGLGLTIVKQILSRLNGDIRVESKLGEGSSFYITLPHAKVSENTGE